MIPESHTGPGQDRRCNRRGSGNYLCTLLLAACTISITVAQVTAPDLSNIGYNSLNPFFSQNPPNFYECTRYAWGRAYERTGTQVTFTVNSGRDGGRWYDLITSNFQRGSTPQPNSFAVWSNGPTQTGHVAYVETVDGQNVTVSEANLDLQGHYAGMTAIPTAKMQVGSNRSGYGLGTAYTLVGYVYLQSGSGGTTCVGCGPVSSSISAIFQAAYNIEAANLGNPTGQVTSYTDTFWSPAISGYYQNFVDSIGRNMSLQLIAGYSQAFSVKWGFSDLYSSVSSYRSHKVYDLVVAPTANQAPASALSVSGTQYTWQPFLKGSMYFFDSGGSASKGWSGYSEYVWGQISERYTREGGSTGQMGLPLTEAALNPTTDGWEWWYQWFERGFIWRAQNVSNTSLVWTYAYSNTGNVLDQSAGWVPLGWIQH